MMGWMMGMLLYGHNYATLKRERDEFKQRAFECDKQQLIKIRQRDEIITSLQLELVYSRGAHSNASALLQNVERDLTTMTNARDTALGRLAETEQDRDNRILVLHDVWKAYEKTRALVMIMSGETAAAATEHDAYLIRLADVSVELDSCTAAAAMEREAYLIRLANVSVELDSCTARVTVLRDLLFEPMGINSTVFGHMEMERRACPGRLANVTAERDQCIMDLARLKSPTTQTERDMIRPETMDWTTPLHVTCGGGEAPGFDGPVFNPFKKTPVPTGPGGSLKGITVESTGGTIEIRYGTPEPITPPPPMPWDTLRKEMDDLRAKCLVKLVQEPLPVRYPTNWGYIDTGRSAPGLHFKQLGPLRRAVANTTDIGTCQRGFTELDRYFNATYDGITATWLARMEADKAEDLITNTVNMVTGLVWVLASLAYLIFRSFMSFWLDIWTL